MISFVLCSRVNNKFLKNAFKTCLNAFKFFPASYTTKEMRHLMPLLMDVLKSHISYQFKSKFEKLNKYSFANNIFMGIGIALYHPFTEFIW